MYLIYVSARQKSSKKLKIDDIPQDLQPIMLALNCDKTAYFLREADSREDKLPLPTGFKGAERIFVKVNEVSSMEELEEKGPSSEELEGALDDGKAQLAVALATIFFDQGKTDTQDRNFCAYIRDRSRIADRIVVAGYTDRNCTLAESERISMRRAESIKRILAKEGLEAPVVTVSRPACAYAPTDQLSRRVEVAALFFSGSEDNEGKKKPALPPQPKAGKDKSSKQTKAGKAAKLGKKAKPSSKKRSQKKVSEKILEPVAELVGARELVEAL